MMQKTNYSTIVLTMLASLAALLCGIGDARAQVEDPQPLNRKLAAQLIADFYEIGEKEITIAFILEGKSTKSGFEPKYGAEVTFILGIVESGRRTRVVRNIRFQHDRALGWFLKEAREDKGREFIDICSETQGRIRIE